MYIFPCYSRRSAFGYCLEFPNPYIFLLPPLHFAPTTASLSPDIVESTEPAVVGVSQLEGSPMDTSSPASATQEEPATNPAQSAQLSQELSGSGESGLTDRQTDVETGWVARFSFDQYI